MRISWEQRFIESVLIDLLVVSAVGWQALAQEKSNVDIVPQIGHLSGVVAFSPDGAFVVTGSASDDTAKIWDVRTGKLLRTLRGAYGSKSVAFSPDGTRVLTGGTNRTSFADLFDARTQQLGNRGSVKLWDAPTGDLLITIEGDELGYVNSVALSHDGTRIVTGAHEGFFGQLERLFF